MSSLLALTLVSLVATQTPNAAPPPSSSAAPAASPTAAPSPSAAPSPNAAPAKAPDFLEPFGWLRDLAGACWHGLHSDGITSDTQCYETQWGRHLRGTIKISWTKDGKSAEDFHGDSVFSYNEQRRVILFTNWSSLGNYGLGEAYLEGEHVIFPSQAKVASTEVRHRWTRVGEDEFTVIRERKVGDAWTELNRVTYHRSDKEGRPLAGSKKGKGGKKK